MFISWVRFDEGDFSHVVYIFLLLLNYFYPHLEQNLSPL